MRQTVQATLAALFIAGIPGIASAVPATVETDLNMRLGPSTGYAVLDTMPGGAVVDVLACYQGWCEVVWRGLDGFASRAYLDIAPQVRIAPSPPGAIIAPGIVVYETRYYERPIWSARGSIIREAIRREIRRDRREVRQERREDRRELKRDRREGRRDVRQERREERQERAAERRRDAQIESIRERRNARPENQRQIRRNTVNRAEAVRERRRRIESRQQVQRPSAAHQVRQQSQERRRQRNEARQNRDRSRTAVERTNGDLGTVGQR